jgi:Na+-driven multidrug efflux pump
MRIIWINGGIAFGILGFSFIFLKVTGINGAAIAWLVAQSIMGLVLLPFLIKALHAKE